MVHANLYVAVPGWLPTQSGLSRFLIARVAGLRP